MMTIARIALLLIVLAVSSPRATAESKKLKIGFIGALSGVGSPYGIACRRGVEMALKDLGADSRLDVVYEDDQFDNKSSVGALTKLLNVDHVDLILTLGSSTSSATAPIAEERGIPMVTWASDPRVSKGRPHVVRTCPTGQSDGNRIAIEASKRGYSRVASFIVNSEYPLSVWEGFRTELSAHRIAYSETVDAEIRDFRSILSRAVASNPDSYFICLAPGQIAIFAKQLRALGAKTPIFGCQTLQDRAEFLAAKEELSGAWYLTTGVTKEFKDRYLQTYNELSVVAGAAVNYDVTLRLNDAAKRGSASSILQNLLATGSRVGPAGLTEMIVSPEDRYLDVPRIVETLSEDSLGAE